MPRRRPNIPSPAAWIAVALLAAGPGSLCPAIAQDQPPADREADDEDAPGAELPPESDPAPQDQTDPPPAPETIPGDEFDPDDTAGDRRDLLARPQPVAPLAPVASSVAEGVVPVNPDAETVLDPLGNASPLSRRQLLREGSFISRRPGWLRRLERGHWLFLFAQRDEGAPLPPVLIVPSPELERAEAQIDDPDGWTPFLLSGQVFAYHDWNYLLPAQGQGLVRLSDAALGPELGRDPPDATNDVPADPAQPTEADPAEETGKAPPPDVAGPRDPEVRRLLESLRDERSGVRSLIPQPRAGGASDPPPSAATTPDTFERFIVARRARLTRTATGAWTLAFDMDAMGEPRDRPAIVVPSMNLSAMERAAGRLGDAAQFEVSGRLFAYRGQPYFVTVLYRELPPPELSSMQ